MDWIAKLTAVPAAAATNLPVAKLFTAIGMPEADYLRALKSVLEAGVPVQIRCTQDTPVTRVIDLTGTPMRDGEDRLAGAVWVFRDVTDAARIAHEQSRTARLESLGVPQPLLQWTVQVAGQ